MNHNHRSKKVNHGSRKVVIIGGGTGQSRVLKALKDDIENLSAIVTMADDGGSTGRLRKYQNAPAVGDLRQCLTALADPDRLWTKVFPYRFGKERWAHDAKDIEGHTAGNIILVALVDVLGGLRQAIAAAARELGVKPSHGVFPSTFENIVLKAQLGNGDAMVGQFNISYNVPRAKKFRIKRVWVDREPPLQKPIEANPDAIEKILAADLILIGPGGLHISILPNLVIPAIRNAVIKAKAKKYYIANTAIKLAETHGFSLEDHVTTLLENTNKDLLDGIITNNKQISHEKTIKMLTTEKTKILEIPIIQADVIDEDNIFVHDPEKLREVLLDLI